MRLVKRLILGSSTAVAVLHLLARTRIPALVRLREYVRDELPVINEPAKAVVLGARTGLRSATRAARATPSAVRSSVKAKKVIVAGPADDRLRRSNEQAREALQAKNKGMSNLRGALASRTHALERTRDALAKRESSIDVLKSRLASSNERSASLADRVRRNQPFLPVLSYLELADVAGHRAAELEADVYMSIDVMALPAAARLAELTGGKVFCDVKEKPNLGHRSLPTSLTPLNLRFLNEAFLGYLRDCDHRITVGWTLARELGEIGVELEVLPNFRRYSAVSANNALKDLCGIPRDHRALLAPNNIVTGAEAILDALHQGSDDTHLVVLGHLKPEQYRAEIEDRARDLDLTERLHYVPPVPYAELVNFASGADAGLIVLDPSIQNHRVSLPNRIFDLLAAELPVVTPPVPDIAKLVHEYQCGVEMAGIEAADWASGIKEVLADQPRLAAGAATAARALTWESVEEQLLACFADAQSVTFLHHKNLHHHQRTIRIATTLQAAGISVKMATRVTDERGITDLPFPVIDLS